MGCSHSCPSCTYMRHKRPAESVEHATACSPFVRRREETALGDHEAHDGLLAYTRISASISAPIGERPMRPTWRPNVLLVGSLTDVEEAFLALVSSAPGPVHNCRLDAPLPPHDRSGVVIIRDVDRLTVTLQDDCLSWLTDGHDRSQIIATSRAPLFPLVEAGLFRSELYYRLNTLLLDLRACP